MSLHDKKYISKKMIRNIQDNRRNQRTKFVKFEKERAKFVKFEKEKPIFSNLQKKRSNL